MDSSQPVSPKRSWWTFRVGNVAGVAIRVHITLLVLLAWIALVYAARGAGAAGTLFGLGLVVSVFAIIVVHELGHALMARRFGYATRDIVLLPIGGIANLERIPERPSQELAVALVGPAINLAIAAVLWIVLLAVSGSLDAARASGIAGAFVAQLVWINVALAVFNLLPAFPMDGGRALRALLALRMPHERATEIAATLGKALAVLIGVAGVLGNPLLILIAAVVWIGASQERALVHLRSALHGVPVSAAMLRHVDTVTPEQSLEDAAALLLSGGQNELPVIDHGQPVGVLTRGDVAAALAHAGPAAPIASAPRHAVVTVAPGDPLDKVLEQLRQSPDAVALVVDHGAPVGLVTAEHLAAYAALHQKRAA
jgi:Zn-dependent protease/CBS domain-containing protein